jgi:hypothetical protein
MHNEPVNTLQAYVHEVLGYLPSRQGILFQPEEDSWVIKTPDQTIGSVVSPKPYAHFLYSSSIHDSMTYVRIS